MDSVENDFIKSYNDPANIFEFAIPLSSLPVSYYTSNYPLLWFNWLGFLSNSGIISSRVPNNANPSGIPDDLSWYYPSSVNNFSLRVLVIPTLVSLSQTLELSIVTILHFSRHLRLHL